MFTSLSVNISPILMLTPTAIEVRLISCNASLIPLEASIALVRKFLATKEDQNHKIII